MMEDISDTDYKHANNVFKKFVIYVITTIYM